MKLTFLIIQKEHQIGIKMTTLADEFLADLEDDEEDVIDEMEFDAAGSSGFKSEPGDVKVRLTIANMLINHLRQDRAGRKDAKRTKH
jgi:polyribonucleotide nucleotidyltransferase